MKKSITFLFVVCCLVNYAQGIRILQGNTDVTGTTVTEKITGDNLITEFQLYNSTAVDKQFIVTRIIKSKLSPDYYFFTIVNCKQYEPMQDSVFTYNDTVKIKAHQYLPGSNLCGGIDVYLFKTGVCQEYVVTFTVCEVDGSNNTSEVTIHYVCPNGITDESLPAIITRVYPNPATDFVSFDYVIPALFKQSTLAIIDVLGKRLKEIRLTSKEGSVKVNISDLPGGFYTYVLLVDEQVMNSGKLMIHPFN